MDPSRVTFTIYGWLVKLPRLGSFRMGARANRSERRFARGHRHCKQVCPVLVGDPFGMLVLTPQTRPLADTEAAQLDALQLLDLFILPDGFIAGEPSRSRVRVWRDRLVVHDCAPASEDRQPRPLA